LKSIDSVPSRPRDLSAITADGVAYSVSVGLGETYIPAFVLAAGLGEVAAGLIATLPPLVGAVFTLVTPVAVRTLHSYRRWVVACASLGRSRSRRSRSAVRAGRSRSSGSRSPPRPTGRSAWRPGRRGTRG
jgi:hypothetical protein